MDSPYAELEAECEKLVELLVQHNLLANLVSNEADLCGPETFRAHGEYGLWVESVYDMLVEYDLPVPGEVVAQIRKLADQMGIRGNRIS